MKDIKTLGELKKSGYKSRGIKDELRENLITKIKAKETIFIIKDFDKIKQMQIILTMYYRAHHHPHRTKDMEKAMKIFKKWLINNGYSKSIIKNKIKK